MIEVKHSSDNKKLLDLCSGIGGFSLAARWMGWETVGFAEIDPFCCRVLKKHWPEVPNYGDIAAVPTGLRADIITAGLPCQPYSCAGKRLGAADDRALWPLAFRVIAGIRPAWIVLENVAGFIEMALSGVLADLESEGYETQAIVLPACAVNAPHRRDRVWVIAHDAGRIAVPDASRIGERKPANEADALANGGQARVESGERREPFSDAHRQPTGRVAEPRRQRHSGRAEPRVGGIADWVSARVGESRRGPGFWDGDWERGVPRVATGVKDRAKRLKALGNSIVPQVAYQIFIAIGESA